MKKILRPLSIMLALLLILSGLAGCGTKAEEKETVKDNADVTASVEDKPSTEAKKDPVMLRWIQIGGAPNNYDNVLKALNDYSIEKIGVGVEFTYLDWGIWGDKVKAMLNSGEKFDIMFVGGSEYNMGVSLGAFADITELRNETPDLKAFLPEKVWEGAQIGGKIYAVPTYKDSSQTQYWVWDKETVDKYQIDYQNIKTVVDLDPVLQKLQQEITAGNIEGTSYAFTVARDGINGFMMNYERPMPALGVRFDDQDTKVVNVFEQEDIMEILTYMHKWNKEGIVNPDAATLDNGPSWCIVSSGQGFPGADVSWSAGRGKEVISTPFYGPLYSTDSILGSVNAISSSSEYKTEALKYLELCNTDPKMRNMLAYGIEGEDYTDHGDGTITRVDNGYNPAAYSQATFFTLKTVAPNPPDQWTKVQEWNEQATASVLLGFAFDRSKVENQLAACDLILSRYKDELYTGTVDPKEAVPQLYKELEAAGLEDIRTEYQAQIDAWKASK